VRPSSGRRRRSWGADLTAETLAQWTSKGHYPLELTLSGARFTTPLGGAPVASLLAADAQQAAAMPVDGFLHAGSSPFGNLVPVC
jgi:hypothetical protein